MPVSLPRAVRSVRVPASAVALAAALVAAPSHAALPGRFALHGARTSASLADELLPISPLSSTAWLAQGIERAERFRLPPGPTLALLERYTDPAVERAPEWRSYFHGRYGIASWETSPSLAWSETSCEPAHDQALATIHLPGLDLAINTPPPVGALLTSPDDLPAPAPELLSVIREPTCPAWRRPRLVTLGRYGGEADTFQLLDCDGSIAPDALDRLSVIARPPGSARPELPLPLDPDPLASLSGEWVAGVKMLHPRLAWVVERIAEAFPRRPIYVISGYRREASRSYHAKGRALDLFVMGVPNEDLFRFCHKRLHDVGCGYYPNNKFVHVDVRPYGTGHPMWIDVSQPGTPSKYVDSWPGVVEGGALTWSGEE